MAVRFLEFYKNVRKKIVNRIINYLDSLNKSDLDTVLDLYNRYQMLLWGCPIILWVANLVLLVFPFHNLNHGFSLLWLFGALGLIAVFVVNRMLINLTTRRNDLNRDERIEEMLAIKREMDLQGTATLGGMVSLPFTFTMIPYTQFLLDHPTAARMNRSMVIMLAGNGFFNNLIWFIAPVLFTAYIYSRVRQDTLQNEQEIEDWMATYEYHNIKMHDMLSGGQLAPHEPDVKLGKSMETGDYVVQTSTTRRQNTVCYGPIGSGKSSTFFIPLIRQDIDSYLEYIRDYKQASQDPNWMKPHKTATHYLNGFNVIDPTNDLCRDVYNMCMELGVPKDKVIWLDPENEKTPGLNLLRGPVEKAAENVTNIISGLKGDNNDFFHQAERTHLKNMIYLLKLTSVMDGKTASFGGLIQMYNDIELVWDKVGILGDYCDELKDKESEAKNDFEQDPDDMDKKSHMEELHDKYEVAWQTYQWFQKNIQVQTLGKNVLVYKLGPHKGEPKHYDVQEEFVKGLLNTLDDISKNIPIRRVLFRDSGDFNLDDFLYNGGILLCNTAKAVVGDQLAEILGQIYTLSLQAATYRRDPNCPPLHPLYADEFPDYLSESFAGFAAQSRKYNVPIIIAAQSPAQLSYKYGNNYFDTLMSVMLTRCTFGDLGATDAKKLEPLFGEHEQTVESVNNQEIDLAADQESNRKMISARREKVPNITASEIMSLERFTLAVRTPGQHSSDMFNRIRVKRVTSEDLANDPYKMDLNNADDLASYQYMEDHEIHDNPDFDEIDKEIMQSIKEHPKKPEKALTAFETGSSGESPSNEQTASKDVENGFTGLDVNHGNDDTGNDDLILSLEDADNEIDKTFINVGGHKRLSDVEKLDSKDKSKSEKQQMGHDDEPHLNIKIEDLASTNESRNEK